jgi:2-polyprenyl-3-methyl-5-hydroxy-6-metoxy-1,4-benzoquinol methylase
MTVWDHAEVEFGCLVDEVRIWFIFMLKIVWRCRMNDARNDLYRDLHEGQLKAEEQNNRQSADCILEILWKYLQPLSALDVGCGIGSWLAALQHRGVKDVRGVDGPWQETASVVCDPLLLQVCDLEAGFALGRTFELVVCLEVAEHLSRAAADRFIASLVRHAPAILFSAAIPFQGGHHHVNEQFLQYWVAHFARHQFRPLDIFRGQIWDDSRVMWWLRQNIVLFAHKDLIQTNEKLRRVADELPRPISIVHPDIYLSRLNDLVRRLGEYQQLETFLRAGGAFRSNITPDGRVNLTRIG